MPNTKSAIKALRQNIKRRKINLKTTGKIKDAVRELKKTAVAKPGEVQAILKKAYSAIDKAAKKRIIHKNTANRKKSRLAKLVAKIKK
jgi:small subunit ribosomal protein S20